MRVSSLKPNPVNPFHYPWNCPKSAPSVDHTLKLPNPNETSFSKDCPLVVGNVWCTTFRTSHYLFLMQVQCPTPPSLLLHTSDTDMAGVIDVGCCVAGF